jgi:hypothetical protein
MRCQTPAEVETVFGPGGLHVDLRDTSYRTALVFNGPQAAAQRRLGCGLPQRLSALTRFAAALNRWLPTDRRRLLWVDHWENNFPSSAEAFMAVRRGLGEARSLDETPGHLFDAHPYHEEDQLEISAAHGRELGLLLGMMLVILAEGWDGWLLAEGESDRVEFWERNVFFHSAEPARIEAAQDLTTDYGCGPLV